VAAELEKVKLGEKAAPASWTQAEPLLDLPPGWAQLAEGVFKAAGYKHTEFYRDRVYDVLSNLSDKQLQEHVLLGLLRTDALPLTIIVTGRGNKAPFTANVEENTSNPSWLTDAAANGFTITKSGNNILSIATKGNKQRIVSVRMKWMSRPFASSVKPTLAK